MSARWWPSGLPTLDHLIQVQVMKVLRHAIFIGMGVGFAAQNAVKGHLVHLPNEPPSGLIRPPAGTPDGVTQKAPPPGCSMAADGVSGNRHRARLDDGDRHQRMIIRRTCAAYTGPRRPPPRPRWDRGLRSGADLRGQTLAGWTSQASLLRQRPPTAPSRRWSAPPTSPLSVTWMTDSPLVNEPMLTGCPRASSAAASPSTS